MSSCKSCQHWRLDRDSEDYRITPFDGESREPMTMPFEVRACNSPKLLTFERPIEASGAAVMDGSDYHAMLYTGEDFACVNYEATT